MPARGEFHAPAPGSTFGQYLAELRRRKGISQSALAELAGFDHSFVSRLENGTRIPSRDAALNLGGHVGASPEEHELLLRTAGFSFEPAVPRHWLADEVQRYLTNPDIDEDAAYLIEQAIRLVLDGALLRQRGR